MFTWLKKLFTRKDVFLFVLSAVVLSAMLAPVSAFAQFKQTGLVTQYIVAASPANKFTFQGQAGQSNNECPKAWLLYSASGAAFWARRCTTSLTTFETYAAKCPENKELVITPLQYIRVSDVPFMTVEIVGTVGDTIKIMPLD